MKGLGGKAGRHVAGLRRDLTFSALSRSPSGGSDEGEQLDLVRIGVRGFLKKKHFLHCWQKGDNLTVHELQ